MSFLISPAQAQTAAPAPAATATPDPFGASPGIVPMQPAYSSAPQTMTYVPQTSSALGTPSMGIGQQYGGWISIILVLLVFYGLFGLLKLAKSGLTDGWQKIFVGFGGAAAMFFLMTL